MIAEEKIAAGIPAPEARRATLAELGGIEQVKQSVRDHRAGAGLELLWQDVRYALRQLRRNRAFTLTAVLTLGLGIGATTAIFSAVYALLLRPLPYPDAGRLMYISAQTPRSHFEVLASQDFVAAQTSTKSFEQFAGYYYYCIQNLTGPAGPSRVHGVNVTANFLPMLGVVPQLGRLFTEDDDRPTGPPVIMLSDHLWRTYFHADPGSRGQIRRDQRQAADHHRRIAAQLQLSRSHATSRTSTSAADLGRDTTIAVDKPMIGMHAHRAAASRRQHSSRRRRSCRPFIMARFHTNIPAEFGHSSPVAR